VTDSPLIAQAKTLSAAALRELREDILNCRLQPGEKLRFSDLKERYGIGLSPLREALHHLTAEGLVDTQDQRGFTVAVMTVEDLRDLVRMRLEIESLTLADALASGDDAWEAEVVRSAHHLGLMGPAAEQINTNITTEWRRRHKAFHMALLSGSGSPRLRNLCDSLFDQSERYRLWTMLNNVEPRDVEAEHDALLAAAIARDTDCAIELLRAHIQRTADDVSDLAVADGKAAAA
jgi:GntR family carbon starvation induced transcriptional regulator